VRRTTRALAATAAGLFAATAMTVLAAPQASAAPVVTYLSCESGGSAIHCWVEYANAAGPVSIRWYANGSLVAPANDRTYMTRGCTVGQSVYVTLTLTDSTGTTDALYGGVSCRREWQ
jgi:hypothetical protein